MKLNHKKLERQKASIQAWKLSKGKGGIEAPTGFGKTFLALFVGAKKMLEARPTSKVIIITHSDDLRTQWKNEVEKLLPNYSKRIYVNTIHFFQNKRLQYNCDLLILDEVDEYFSEDRSNIWNGTWINFKWLLWLSATPKDRQKRDKEFLNKYPCVDIVTKKECIKHNWITNYEIYNIGVELDEEERKQYDYASEVITNNLSKFNNNFEFANRCLNGYVHENKEYSAFQCATMWASRRGWIPSLPAIVSGEIKVQKETLEAAKNIMNQWTPNHIIGYAKELFKYIKIRNKLLWQAKAKADLFVRVVKHLPESKVIGFGQSTEFANIVENKLVSAGVKAVAYHSKINNRPLRFDDLGNPSLFGNGDFVRYVTKSSPNYNKPKVFGKTILKRLITKSLLLGEIDALITASAVDKGLNAPVIDLAIVTSFTGNPSQFKQRVGRAIRIDPENPDKLAYIVCFYVKNSKERRVLQKIQEVGEPVYWIDTVEEIGQKQDSEINLRNYSI